MIQIKAELMAIGDAQESDFDDLPEGTPRALFLRDGGPLMIIGLTKEEARALAPILGRRRRRHMTDPYAALRAAIEEHVTFGDGRLSYDTEPWHAAASPDVIRALLAERDALAADAQRLRAALSDAADDIAGWGIYASEYFQTKHDLAGCIAKYRAIAAQGKEPTE